MKKILAISALAILAVSTVPATMVFAAAPKSTVSIQQTVAKTGTTTQMIATKNTPTPTKKGSVTPNTTTNLGNGGTATVTCVNVGGGYMDVDWTLISSNGPITYVNLTTAYDDGVNYLDAGSRTANSAQYGSSQWNIGGGYHSATLTGWCYVDYGLISDTLIPTTDGCFVSY